MINSLYLYYNAVLINKRIKNKMPRQGGSLPIGLPLKTESQKLQYNKMNWQILRRLGQRLCGLSVSSSNLREIGAFCSFFLRYLMTTKC